MPVAMIQQDGLAHGKNSFVKDRSNQQKPKESMSPFGFCRVLLHMFCNYFMTKGVFLISDALLDVDHFFLG